MSAGTQELTLLELEYTLSVMRQYRDREKRKLLEIQERNRSHDGGLAQHSREAELVLENEVHVLDTVIRKLWVKVTTYNRPSG